jgi:hypothetical protein
MVSSRYNKATLTPVLLLMAVLVIPASVMGLKQEKSAKPVPRPTVDKADSHILWQFNTGG